MKKITVIFLLFISTFYSRADSPLTSIKYWNTINDSFVLFIGNISGKQKLTKKMITYLQDPEINTFNKLTLINAIGWEFQSKVKNSSTYLNFLIKKHKKLHNYILRNYQGFEEDSNIKKQFIKEFLNQLKNDEYVLIYAYLRAMDNYTDITFSLDLLKTNNSNYTAFILKLLQMQDASLKMKFQEVAIFFDDYITECTTDKNILNVLPVFNKYIQNYRSSFTSGEAISIFLDKICNLDTYYINNNREIWVTNYPVFVYGTLTLLDESNDIIEQKIIDGDDYVLLNPVNYVKGVYKLILKDSQTLEEHIIKLIIE
ncbi:hypothetical protein [uncultured Polaribacter sp.]|uniref:hypothetical protein n=1 Tax=uncultured Polaribacter sp. TaxID=174711 RepID=UPI00260DD754|nr:hypothetical protein [uncultured Polaribacter sp.]